MLEYITLVGQEDGKGPRIEAVAGSGRISHLGWDTEGGDRAEQNILRSPLRLLVLIGGEWSEVWRPADIFPAETASRGSSEWACSYRIEGQQGDLGTLLWSVRMTDGGMVMRFECEAETETSEQIRGVKIIFAFDLDLCSTTVISGSWTPEGHPVLPAVISVPDHGEMQLCCAEHPGLEGVWQGSRAAKYANFILEMPAPADRGITLEFTPVQLQAPAGLSDTGRWPAVRRGWTNFLQVHAECGKERADKESPAGLWTNNVISNPVSSLTYLLGDYVLLLPEPVPGISLTPLLRRSVEYWITSEIAPNGRIYYFENGERVWPVMDSNPAVLIGAWAYVEATGDDKWLAENITRLEHVAAYIVQRDTDNDGLIESEQTGNSGSHKRPDSGWDTFCSGHKNSYINALAYRAFCCMADLEKRLDRNQQTAEYTSRAERIRTAFYSAFYNPDTGWLGWWRSEDGVLHDVYSDVPSSMAAAYGLVTPKQGRDMQDAWWEALEQTGFDRFDLGLPLMLRPVPKEDQINDEGHSRQTYFVSSREDGMDTFGRWLNGGCCVSNTYWFLMAGYASGREERADRILDAMIQRQAEGVFPNGGGFQNGVVDMMPFGAEFFEWDGKPSGYEGHLVYSWAFLQCVLLREPVFRSRILRPLILADNPESKN